MLRRGFFTSSPAWTMISYPSKAMNVKPMATKTLPTPVGKKGSKWAKGAGRVKMRQRPPAMKTPMTASLPRVTMLPVIPVSEVPR